MSITGIVARVPIEAPRVPAYERREASRSEWTRRQKRSPQSKTWLTIPALRAASTSPSLDGSKRLAALRCAYFALAMEWWLWRALRSFPSRSLWARFPPWNETARVVGAARGGRAGAPALVATAGGLKPHYQRRLKAVEKCHPVLAGAGLAGKC